MTEEIKFEKALERLEKIVEDLEAGNVSLEEALKKYEEGVKLSVLCQRRLWEAEKKIEVLTKTLSGSFKKGPFTGTDDEAPRLAAAKKSKVKPPAPESGEPESDEDLLI